MESQVKLFMIGPELATPYMLSRYDSSACSLGMIVL